MDTSTTPSTAPVETDWSSVPTPALATTTRGRLQDFTTSLARTLDFWIDRRLVRTFVDTLEALVLFRNRAHGLLLSELGAYLASPAHAPAGTKRLSHLLHNSKWNAALVGAFLEAQAQKRLVELEKAREEPLVLWDQSVVEKSESIKADGLMAVRSTKAARLKRVKPGFYTPPSGPPVFVPGYSWLALLICGCAASGPSTVARMEWWTKRGAHATDQRAVQTQALDWAAATWKRRVLHVFDRGYAGAPWLEALHSHDVRFLLRWPKRYHLMPMADDGTDLRPETVPAWQVARGKRAWDAKQFVDTHTKDRLTVKILAFRVRHPQVPLPLWLVVARSGKRREPWYLLTNEPVATKQDAWRLYYAYHRRWLVETAFRFNKSELGMESLRVREWEAIRKLLAMVTVVYAFLLTLLVTALSPLIRELLRRFCHRTGKRGRETSTPIYRLRIAIALLWMSHRDNTRRMSTLIPG